MLGLETADLENIKIKDPPTELRHLLVTDDGLRTNCTMLL